jgi:hypothetical protein
VAELIEAHTRERLRPRGSTALEENEEGAQGNIIVASEGGGAARFGLAVGWWRQ